MYKYRYKCTVRDTYNAHIYKLLHIVAYTVSKKNSCLAPHQFPVQENILTVIAFFIASQLDSFLCLC